MKKNVRKNRIFAACIFIALLLVAGGAWAGARYHFDKVHSMQRPTEVSKGYVNLSPPTAQDKADTQAHKEAIAKNLQSQQTSTPSTNSGTTTTKTQVTPIITTYAQGSTNLMVNGFVEGVAENGGTCTLGLTKDGKTVTQSRQAVINATNTSCGQTDIPLSSLTPGTWRAVLSYSSATSEGVSQAKDITVN